jgi:hypothetical protein
MPNSTRLNWRDHASGGSEARASSKVGGRYKIHYRKPDLTSEEAAAIAAKNGSIALFGKSIGTVWFEIEHETRSGNGWRSRWFKKAAASLNEAKAIAEADNAQTYRRLAELQQRLAQGGGDHA